MTKQKLESIVNTTISARKYSHAKFHAVNCGPGQPLIKLMRIHCAERRSIDAKFVEFYQRLTRPTIDCMKFCVTVFPRAYRSIDNRF